MTQQEIPTLPEPAGDPVDRPIAQLSLEELRDAVEAYRVETRNLRNWCGQIFLVVKDAITRAADAETIARENARLVSNGSQNYTELSNAVNEHSYMLKTLVDDLEVVLDALGLTEGEPTEQEK
jgi:hypothetical protein